MRFWVGGYSDDADGSAPGIGVLHAGAPDAVLAGDLALAGVAARALSPSWIAAHPSLDVIYAAEEVAGTVKAFVRTGEESFTPLGAAVDAGELVCHVAVAPDGGSLIASCWGDGRVVRYPLSPDGRIGAARVAPGAADPYAAADLDSVGDASPLPGLDAFAAMGDLPLFGQAPVLGAPAIDPDAARDVAPAPEVPPANERTSRAHQARHLPGGIVATTDMGFDLVRFWSRSRGAFIEDQRVALPRGSGPRHMVWHPSGHLYVVTELSLEAFVLAPDPAARASERWRIVGGTPLAREVTVGADAAAEIALTRDGQHAVIGIRGSNTLASLRVHGGGAELRPVALAESGVDWPRHHVIARDTILVAGQRSNDVTALALDERTGVPGRVRGRVEVPSPTRLLPDRR